MPRYRWRATAGGYSKAFHGNRMAAHGIVSVRFRRGRLPGMGPEADAESSTLRFARAPTPRLLCDTQLPTRRTFGNGSAAAAAKPLTRFEKAPHPTSSADFWFGIGSVAGRRFVCRQNRRCVSSAYEPAPARVPWTLNPLVVGSIPTRPTNTFKGLASNAGPLSFSARRKTRARGRALTPHPRPRTVLCNSAASQERLATAAMLRRG